MTTQRHLDYDNDASVARQDAVSATRRIEWTPTASAVSAKRQGKRERILERLRSGSATTWDLMMLGGAGFSSRLHELRVAGHEITVEMNEDHAIYTLVEP